MKHFNFKTIALVLAISASVVTVNGFKTQIDGNSRLGRQLYEVKPVREFKGQKPWGVEPVQNLFDNAGRKNISVKDPAANLTGLSNYDFLEMPDGSTWFYTAEFETKLVETGETGWDGKPYTEEQIVGFTFTIYDDTFTKVGTIRDKVTFRENETRVATLSLDPAVTYKFFNDDDLPEVMVYSGMNTSAALGYHVNYYNKVYSIGGEKDSEGNDVCLAVIEGRCADTINASNKAGEEDYYFTFVNDIDPDEEDYDSLVDFVNAYKTELAIYGKAKEPNKPELVLNYEIFLSNYPGDTTDGIYFISKLVGDTPFFVFSHYEKPYFVDPTGFAQDESATPDNRLVIDVYKKDKLTSTTKIPVEIEPSTTGVNYTFYSIGSVAWRDDIDVEVNGTPDAPAFIVARDYTTAANLEDVVSSYDIYGNDGTLKKNLASGAESLVTLSALPGHERQIEFIINDEAEGYRMEFVDMYSAKKVLSLPQYFAGDFLTSVGERMAHGNSYIYGIEMQYDETDSEGNDIKRIAWITPEGKLDRIDRINMGKGVQFAQVNLFAESLSPTLYDSDDEMEYAVLVKRTYGSTTRNEFIVVDHTGDWYAHFSEDDGKGNPYTYMIVPGTDMNRAMMVYCNDDYEYHVDLYNLPFDKEDSVVEVGADKAGMLYDGSTLIAPGCEISVYNALGVNVAKGSNALSVDKLAQGIYVAVAKDANGKRDTVKFTK